jgi:hypothetical protein
MIDSTLLLLVGILIVAGLFIHDDRRETFYEHQAQGDPKLRNIYRRIHNLEAAGRNEIAQNHEFPGARHNTSRDVFTLEHIWRENSRLGSLARNEIAKRRVPFRAQNPSAIGDDFNRCHFDDCQLQMDWNERILGIPSVPGNIHTYHTNV